MAVIQDFDQIVNRDITDAQAMQFLAEQQHARDVEWDKKHGRNPMELFGNCQ
jgi:hypothetical protein